MTTLLAIHGVTGRMGRTIAKLVLESDDLALASAIARAESAAVGQDVSVLVGHNHQGVKVTSNLETALNDVDVVLDFSKVDATKRLLAACRDRCLPAIIGTTGLDVEAERAIDQLSNIAPVVVAPNTSVGVAILFYLAARAAELLGPDFDAEIIDIHHRTKLDAPSGTAARLASEVASAKGLDPETALVYGRSGTASRRHHAEVGVHALRAGDVVGDHTLVFAGFGERLELTHRAHDRMLFARGAVRAARWIVGRTPGRYEITDVIGIPR